MIVAVFSIILCIIFIALGSIHFYWLFGGKWGLKKVIPVKNEEENLIPPPKFATLIVAIILIVFGLSYFLKSGVTNSQTPNWLTNYGLWIIPIVFLLRAIGEFKYVGFFKRIKNTDFAKADSKWFSPLCLLIGIIGILIQLICK